MRIIPAIDLIDGKCVRLSQGDYDQKKVYHEDPLEVAREFEAAGLKYLHLVDLDGAKSGGIVNHRVLEKICQQTSLKVDFGGGIKSRRDLDIAFSSGAQQVTCGSLAVKQPELFLEFLQKFGKEKIILGADCKDGKILTHGWLETSSLEVENFIAESVKNGVQYVVCTDVSKDGMLQGPSFNLYEKILNQNQVNLIASGGISSLEDLQKLRNLGCEGAIVGKAIYEGKISLKDLAEIN